jgi:Uma2 family endonuclease
MMSTLPHRTGNDYPTSDGKPMAETERHRKVITRVIELLESHYSADPNVYVSGNMLLFYEEGNKRRHVSPDCFVVIGVPKDERQNYLQWEEGKGPDVVIKITSKSTRSEDTKKKFTLYQDVLRVKEYILFDPLWHYLQPPLRGYQLVKGKYQRIDVCRGRLSSRVLGLDFEADGTTLRIWDPKPAKELLSAAERLVQLEDEITRLKLAQSNGARQNGH